MIETIKNLICITKTSDVCWYCESIPLLDNLANILAIIGIPSIITVYYQRHKKFINSKIDKFKNFLHRNFYYNKFYYNKSIIINDFNLFLNKKINNGNKSKINLLIQIEKIIKDGKDFKIYFRYITQNNPNNLLRCTDLISININRKIFLKIFDVADSKKFYNLKYNADDKNILSIYEDIYDYLHLFYVPDGFHGMENVVNHIVQGIRNDGLDYYR